MSLGHVPVSTLNTRMLHLCDGEEKVNHRQAELERGAREGGRGRGER